MRRPASFLTGTLLFATALAGCAGTLKTPEKPAARAPAEDPSLLTMAAVLRAEDRRIVDDALRAALADPGPRVRARAVRAVGRIAAPGARESLLAAISDPDPSVKAKAVFALGQLGDASVLPGLRAAARDADPSVRSAVAETLGKFHDPSDADTLAGLIDDPDPGVRLNACLAAWKFADPSFAVAHLLRTSGDAEPYVAFGAAYALARLAAAPSEPATSGAVPGSLSETDRGRVRDRLVFLAASRVPEVRMQAARGLFAPTDPRETQTLGTLSSDPEFGVRVNAIRSLCYPGAEVGAPVRAALGAKEKPLAHAAAEGLGRIATASARDLLVQGIVRESNLWVKEAMLASLGRVDPELAAGVAAGLSEDKTPELRAAAARLLAARTDPKSLEAVGRLLQDPDPRVQVAAVASRAGADGTLANLLGASPSASDPAVREAVARVAGLRLRRPRALPEEREEALVMIEALWKASAADALPLARLETLDAASRAGKDPRAHAVLRAGLDDRERLVRLRAIDLLRTVFAEDHKDRAGAASERPVEDYIEVLRWASKPRAAIVTVLREGHPPGRFTVALDTEAAPLAARNFAQLADRGFFDGLTVHRVVPNFVVQDGDPRGDGNGDPGYSIRDELGRSPYHAGTLGMATDGPDTGGSQWFVTLSAQPHLDGRYTVFGYVAQNFPGVVLKILPGDRIVTIRTYEGTGNEPFPPM